MKIKLLLLDSFTMRSSLEVISNIPNGDIVIGVCRISVIKWLIRI